VIRGGTLEISRVTLQDAGRYRCIAINQAGRAETYTDLQIIDSSPGGSDGPSVQIIPADRDVPIGETVEFLCEARGFPPPTIQWSRDGAPLPQQNRVSGGILLLYQVRAEDSGRYICTATNNFGSNRAYAILRVGGSGGGLVPGGGGVREQQQTVSIGDRVDLECHVRGSPPPTVMWEKVNSVLPANSIVQGHILVIPAVGQEDGGTYRCVARNQLGTVFAQISLIVEAAPVFTMERQVKAATVGAKVSLRCQASGNPPPTVTWSKRRGDLPDNHEVRDGTLLIPSLAPEDFGEYVCTASNQFGRSESVVILEHTGEFVPYFTQNPTSYISYPTLRDAYLDFDLEMSFNPEASDGLLVYNGQNVTSDGDFMCIGMKDNAVEFRFDVGSGPVIIRSDPIDLNQWHTIRVQRDRKDGTLVVNGREYRGQVQGQFVGLDLDQPMYVGGVPNLRLIAPGAGYREGFVGGVSRMEIRGVPLDIQGEAMEVVGVREFPVCQRRPCQRGGTCRPAGTPTGYECDCPPGYSGLRCELVGDRCYPGVCGAKGTCVDLPEGRGYKCVCPLGHSGDRCEQGFAVSTPAFNRSSYVAYPKIENAQQQVQISLMFRPRSLEDGLLLYNAAGTDGYGDFISLAIKDRHLEFRYDSGSGEAVIRSEEEIQEDTWSTLVAERNQQDGSLSINGGIAVKGVSPGNTVGLNLRSPLYIGGVEPSTRIAPGVGVTRGFHGCISDLVVRGQVIDMVYDAIGFSNVRDCDRDESPCARRPCQNGGVCDELSPTDYICNCPRQFTGLNCETERNICTQSNPCANGATCEADPRTGTFRCLCPLGFSGATCSNVAQISTAAGFRGDGYIELPASLLPHTNPSVTEVVKMTVRTDQSDGLLFWHGQNATRLTRGGDYLGVGLKDGRVMFTYDFGSGAANITSDMRIDDGQAHELTLIRTGQKGNLVVDGLRDFHGSSGGILSMLNTESNIFIGGTPNQERMTNGLFPFSLIGCISNVVIQNLGPIDLARQSVGGANVQPCV
jgi:dystroglycan 1